MIVKRLLLSGAGSTSVAFIVESCRQHPCITCQEHLLMKLQHSIGHHTVQRIIMWYDDSRSTRFQIIGIPDPPDSKILEFQILVDSKIHQILGQRLAESPIIWWRRWNCIALPLLHRSYSVPKLAESFLPLKYTLKLPELIHIPSSPHKSVLLLSLSCNEQGFH